MDFIPVIFVFGGVILIVLATEHCNEAGVCLLKGRGGMSAVCGTEKLQCEAHQTVRIINTKIYKRTNGDDECYKCEPFDNFEPWSITGDDFMKIQYKLYQSCSYQTNCTLKETFPKPDGIKKKKMWFIAIDYCCIDLDDINDVCSELNENITDTETYIAIQHDVMSLMTQNPPSRQCYCMIHGDVNITLVEYTPCIYNSCSDNRTVLYVDGEEPYNCGDDCENTIYYNEPIQRINLLTNITITNIYRDVMFWIMVTSTTTEGEAFVSCNMPLTSPSSSHLTSTTPSQSTSPSSNANQPEARSFPVGAVTGGVIGSVCVVSIFVVVVLFYRARRGKGPAENDNQYNTVQFTQHSTTASGRGVVNNAYEPTIESNLNQHPEIRDDYSTPNDSVYDQPEGYTDPKSAVDGTNDTYTEPYPNDDFDDDYSTMSGGQNFQQDASTYNTFAESDTYSHIHTAGKNHVTPKSDNYSNLTLPAGNAHVGGVEAQEMNVYNHITLNDGDQGAGTKPPGPGNYYNVEL